MAITPVGGMIYANQNMQAPATQQADFQQRLEAQTNAAIVASNEQKKEVEEVRPAEETYKIDPDREHEKEKSDEEAGAEEEQIFSKNHKREGEVEEEEHHLLDIKI